MIRKARNAGPRPATPLTPLLFGALGLACLSCGDTGSGPGSGGELPQIPAEATSWLQANVDALEGTSPDDDPADLEPFRAMVGDARVVALGEATHGTREFFRLKHRMIRFLVREMGFDAVAFEAPWAESYRIDEHVRTGAGDPEILLSGLYLWPWNAREVLDLILWMRAQNQDGGAEPVRFFGFDMQFPGMPLEHVRRYVGGVDPASVAWVEGELACLDRFANDPRGAFPSPGYEDQLRQAHRDPCRERLEGVHRFLADREASYTDASSPGEFARALRSARVAIQYEDWASSRTPGGRDLSMSENARWILARLGPDARLVLWAHNYHVADLQGAMGRALRNAWGQDLVIVGFNFREGRFNASPPGVPTRLGQAEPHRVDGPVAWAYGHYFGSAGIPRFLLDLRGRSYRGAGSSWLPGPRPLRAIGSDFDPADPDDYFHLSRLPDEFDVVAYLERSTPSTLLPFRYPGSF